MQRYTLGILELQRAKRAAGLARTTDRSCMGLARVTTGNQSRIQNAKPLLCAVNTLKRRCVLRAPDLVFGLLLAPNHFRILAIPVILTDCLKQEILLIL